MAVAGVLAGHVVKRDAYQDGLLPDNNIISDFYDQRATGQQFQVNINPLCCGIVCQVSSSNISDEDEELQAAVFLVKNIFNSSAITSDNCY